MICIFSAHAFDAQLLIDHVCMSIEKASQGSSKLNASILDLSGFSGAKGRHLLNNLCSLPGACYLEIGVFSGSTFISALYGNADTLLDAVAVDHWIYFSNERHTFLDRTSTHLPNNSFRLIEQNSFTIDVNAAFPNPVTIYFYDGDHSEEAQRLAFAYFNPILADTFIAIIDDWDAWPKVKSGTKRAFKELGYVILYEASLGAGRLGTVSDSKNWWNGMYVAVIQKSP